MVDDATSSPQPSTDPARFRKTPQIKTTASTAHKSVLNRPMAEQSDDAGDPAEARAALAAYNKDVLARLKEVEAQFKDENVNVDPTKDGDFHKFVRGQLAYVNMTYVTTGRFPADARVGGPIRHMGLGDEIPIPPGLDPALAGHPAVQDALRQGADLVGDDDD